MGRVLRCRVRRTRYIVAEIVLTLADLEEPGQPALPMFAGRCSPYTGSREVQRAALRAPTPALARRTAAGRADRRALSRLPQEAR